MLVKSCTTLQPMLISRWKLATILLLIVGMFFMIHAWFYCPKISQPGLDENEEDTEKLREQSSEFYLEVREYQDAPWGDDGGPSGAYEMTRHRLHEQIKELWSFASEELKAAMDETQPKKLNQTLQNLFTKLERKKNMLLVEQQRLSSVDGHAERRARYAADLSDLVQRRLRALQNPRDCAAARKLICDLDRYCGFGCQVHHIVYCLRAAYATERTLVLGSRVWKFKASWDSLFEPLSDNCYNITFQRDKAVNWPDDKAQLVYLKDRPEMSLGVPEDLAYRIMSFNGDPAAWFVGQILMYVLRPRAHFQKTVDQSIAKVGNYRHPIVGMHIRRTDKLIWEAKFHHIHEYMQQAENYWLRRDLARKPGELPTPRRVFLACDDVTVFEKARSEYPSVEFLGDKDIARSASVNSRWSLAALTGVVVDLILLARADFLVGRAAYELMQTNRVDASESYFSLDFPYHFWGEYNHSRRITKPQETTSRTDRPLRWMQLPWYKTEKNPVLYRFPEYKQVPFYS